MLMALLVKDRERQDIFLRRFDQFFDLPSAAEKRFASVDVEKALADLKTLAEDKGHTPQRIFIRRFGAKSSSEEKPASAKYGRQAVLLVALGIALALLGAHYYYFPSTPPQTDRPISAISLTPIPTPAPSKPPLTITLEPVSPKDTRTLAINTGIAAVLLMLIGLYGFYLWWSRRIPLDLPPRYNRDAPRHFRLSAIGAKLTPRLDKGLLDRLSDQMGYFQSEQVGRQMDLNASVKATINRGISALIFQKRRQVYHALILEDTRAGSRKWNPIAAELADGLRQRAIPVTHGQFDGSPQQFQTTEGGRHSLEDLEDRRHGYLVLIFGEGHHLNLRRNALVDDHTVWLASLGFPVYPATREGLVKVMTRFLTE